ncbi:MAG: M14 family zinc carboxypeptidase, partial [Ilumatobacteraceae bacterium]
MTYDFDRFLRYDEMAAWLRALAAQHPTLLTVESYGQSHMGRDLLVATITDTRSGEHHTKPAHWIDANIHAVEVTGGVAALYIIHHLVTKFVARDATVVEALRTRTFYIAPRVNPDGVEDALADRPLFHRSSVRPWPWRDGHRWPGLHPQDIDGDGRILTMRIADADGAWMQHPEEPRVMIP